MNKRTLLDATRLWVSEFNAIPQSLIEKAYNFDELFEMELTPVAKKYECENCNEEFDKDFYENEALENEYGDKLCPSCLTVTCDTCHTKFDKDDYENAVIDADGDRICKECLEANDNDIEITSAYLEIEENFIEELDDYDNHEYGLPMWGTMWTFNEGLDEDWARNNLEVMAECGFKVFESDELGIFFGINGAGYDFYEGHWIPLYKARGLRWHDEE